MQCVTYGCSNSKVYQFLCKKCYNKEYNRQYRAKNKAVLDQKSKQYYTLNKTYLNEYNRKYISENKAAVIENGYIYRRSITGKFKTGKNNAARRNIEWKLTLEEYRTIISSLCHYCEKPTPEAGVGLDRKNNHLGYTSTNVVPCCARCNDMKGQHITYEEMLSLWKARLACSAG